VANNVGLPDRSRWADKSTSKDFKKKRLLFATCERAGAPTPPSGRLQMQSAIS
jgi:hypothetical protein